jgi:hypothetical protein
MLGQHPQMFGLPETRVFEVDSMREWWFRYGAGNADGDGLFRSVAEIVFGGQTPGTVRRAKQWVRRRCQFCRTAEVFDELGERLRPLRLVEKTPLEGIHEREIRQGLERRFGSSGQPLFLHLVRHPIDYGRSQLQHLRRMAEAAPDPQRVERRYAWVTDATTDPPTIDPQVLWHRVNQTIAEFLDRIPKSRWMRIRSESVLEDPDGVLARVSRWLGVRHDSLALDEMKHPERSPFACIGPINARWGSDPGFLSDPRFRTSQAGASQCLNQALPWRKDGKGFTKPVRNLAMEFGYQ